MEEQIHKVKKILVAIDFSAYSKSTLDTILSDDVFVSIEGENYEHNEFTTAF